ncbi:MAG: nitrous oxide reductase accessory protein NosL [Thermohalobaculum sp.]|nr:nitrous oxide reductase accessory protein NosL [Thermohalobaculum sp.]
MKRALIALLLLGACGEEPAAPPAPVAIDATTTGHYCMMVLADHGGPKAQIHLEGYPAPLFFSQVRDALAYLRGPEREARVLAVYVNDMARAPSWENPGPDNWIAASDARYVVGADVVGGMGAPEIAPFGDEVAASAFIARHGGKAMAFDDIPDDAVLGPVEIDLHGKH